MSIYFIRLRRSAPTVTTTRIRHKTKYRCQRNDLSLYSTRVNPEALQVVALAVAAERSLDRILTGIVQGLAAQPGVALARVWLIAPGDICESCAMRMACPDQTRCLHLAATAGGS